MERLGPAAARPVSWCYRVKLLLWVEEPKGGLHHFAAWLLRRGSSPQRTDSLPQLLVSLVTSVGRCPMPLQGVGGHARPFLAEPLSPGDSPSFKSPTTRVAPTWTPPRCGGTTGSSSTRSPSRLCRSRWGSEPPVPVHSHAQTHHQAVRGVSSGTLSDRDTLCWYQKRRACRTTASVFFVPSPPQAGFSSEMQASVG